MHIENTTKGRDLSPATDELWKKFYVRQFGIESANLVVERMGQKRVIFKWKQLYEAKLKDREEATQKSLDRIKKRYQEEDANVYTLYNPQNTIGEGESVLRKPCSSQALVIYLLILSSPSQICFCRQEFNTLYPTTFLVLLIDIYSMFYNFYFC
ncbi:uncharacterized protein [Primulina huaijiensis]|uniref:uncharacterized protein isoform X2 n=1 Tax=Primulina huaijiensis TaxID=1492673 RepID=UPI003CC783EC